MTDRLGRFLGTAAAALVLCGGTAAGALGFATAALARIVIIPANTIARQSTHQGDWHLTIARDKFSGELACQLKSRDGRGIYRSGKVGFRFYFVRGVADAEYRIDGGDIHVARDDLPRLIAMKTPVDHGSMADPAGGVVWVPYDRIAQARSITIEPQRGDRARLFRLRGLAALHDIAVARGCAPESRFVEK